jgi:hypothetical protein
MLQTMTRKKPAGSKTVITARIDNAEIAALDALASKEGTIQYQRSRSELVAFAIREYVQRHAETKPRK